MYYVYGNSYETGNREPLQHLFGTLIHDGSGRLEGQLFDVINQDPYRCFGIFQKESPHTLQMLRVPLKSGNSLIEKLDSVLPENLSSSSVKNIYWEGESLPTQNVVPADYGVVQILPLEGFRSLLGMAEQNARREEKRRMHYRFSLPE